MSIPGMTKTVTLGNGWVKLATLYGAPTGEGITMPDGNRLANGVLVSTRTYAAQIAWDTDSPTDAGHYLAVGQSMLLDNQEWVRQAWMRNDVVGSNAVLTITPIYE